MKIKMTIEIEGVINPAFTEKSLTKEELLAEFRKWLKIKNNTGMGINHVFFSIKEVN